MKRVLKLPISDSLPQLGGGISSQCRLCGGKTLYQFNKKILFNKYEVNYFKCIDCLSLQTEKPYWLDEAYSKNLASLDTGAVQRNLHNVPACILISMLYKFRNIIDLGGGDGLLTRLLRDYGLNCFVKDKYADATYSQGYTEPNFIKPDMVLAFEVFEHFSNPVEDLDHVFHYKPKALLITTEIYTNVDINWWYLSPQSGQHIFFYSRDALSIIAKKYGYKLIISNKFILFIQPDSLGFCKLLLTKFLLNRYINRLFLSLIVLLPTPNSWKDHLKQCENKN